MTYTTRIAEAKTEAFEEDIAIGEKRGISLGITQGEHKKAVETARNLLSKNIPQIVIAECTGLSIEEIEKL